MKIPLYHKGKVIMHLYYSVYRIIRVRYAYTYIHSVDFIIRVWYSYKCMNTLPLWESKQCESDISVTLISLCLLYHKGKA